MMNYPSYVNKSEIEISYTDAYFIIRSVHLNGTNNGITLENVANGAVEYSNLESSLGDRVLVVSSQNILLYGNNIPGGVCGYSDYAPYNCDEQDSVRISSSAGITLSNNNVGSQTYFPGGGFADYRVQNGVNVVGSSGIEVIGNSFAAVNFSLQFSNSTVVPGGGGGGCGRLIAT